jgi:ABC-type Mn2+/Zn2+ transport system permease subunit
MSTPASPTSVSIGAPPRGVTLKDSSVSLVGVNETLFQFLTVLGIVHETLWGIPVVVTSGTDGKHATNSKHATGNAVDLRGNDIAATSYATFLLILMSLSNRFKLAVFDESNLPGEAHVHVEIAG